MIQKSLAASSPTTNAPNETAGNTAIDEQHDEVDERHDEVEEQHDDDDENKLRAIKKKRNKRGGAFAQSFDDEHARLEADDIPSLEVCSKAQHVTQPSETETQTSGTTTQPSETTTLPLETTTHVSAVEEADLQTTESKKETISGKL